MKHNLSKIENALMFVSSGMPFESAAVLNKETGEIYYRSDFTDDEFPDDVEEGPYISIPHKNRLDLGRDLVFRFAQEVIPSYQDRVYRFFRSKGAYSRFKGMLEDIGKLQEWFDFENRETERALLEWCKDNGIDVDRADGPDGNRIPTE